MRAVAGNPTSHTQTGPCDQPKHREFQSGHSILPTYKLLTRDSPTVREGWVSIQMILLSSSVDQLLDPSEAVCSSVKWGLPHYLTRLLGGLGDNTCEY